MRDVERPVPKDGEALIKVRAASVNPLDWHFMRGLPYFIRIMTGLRRPKETRLGVDVAGRVEAVGTNVTDFRAGDEVFGSCRGAFAEFVCASAAALVMKPPNLTFDQAASVPVAAVTALQGLRDAGRLQRGQKVLINGAAGGVGTFAVQIAKSLGAHVAAVCSTRNVDMVRSIGADRVIDYTRDDFTRGDERYDVILDCIGNHSVSACRKVLTSAGRYVAIGGPSGRWMIGSIAATMLAILLSRFTTRKTVAMLMRPNKQDLLIVSDLIGSGKVTPVVDKRYTLNEVSEAVAYVEAGHARGKVVITVEPTTLVPA